MERLHHCNQHIKPATHLAIFANHNNWPKLPTVPTVQQLHFFTNHHGMGTQNHQYLICKISGIFYTYHSDQICHDQPIKLPGVSSALEVD